MTTATPRTIRLDRIQPSKTNPRKVFDVPAIKELAESVRRFGVLQPILLRQAPGEPAGEHYEIVAGERRWRAAKEAGLTEIPAIVRELSDAQVLEIQVIENLVRADLHPMEEAEGYEALHRRHRYSVDEIASKIGRSTAYVYERMKLCALVKEARKAFQVECRFPVGHALLLARLKPADQRRAIDPANNALFEHESTMWDPTDSDCDLEDRTKPRSLREFQDWINKHVRFDLEKDADPILFPQTREALDRADDQDQKVIPITHLHVVPAEARSNVRTLGPHSWRSAAEDPCPDQVMGLVVIGPRRGEAIPICTKKDSCKVHWRSEIADKARRSKVAAGASMAPPRKPSIEEIAHREAVEKWERETADAAARKALTGLVTAVEANPEVGIRAALEVDGWALRQVLSDRGLVKNERQKDVVAAARVATKGWSLGQLAGLLVEIVITHEGLNFIDDSMGHVMKDVGINLKTLLKAERAATPAPQRPSPVAPKQRGGKKPQPSVAEVG